MLPGEDQLAQREALVEQLALMGISPEQVTGALDQLRNKIEGERMRAGGSPAAGTGSRGVESGGKKE